MKRVFVYNLSEVVSYDFKKFFESGVEIDPYEFNTTNFYDYYFSDELIEAIEKETGKKIDEIDTEIINTIANRIAYESYSNVAYVSFYEFIADEYIKNFRFIIDAGNEFIYNDCKDIYNLEGYYFKIDFSKLHIEDKENYKKYYGKTDKKYLLDFLNYDFGLFEKHIEKKLYSMQLDYIINGKVLDAEVKECLKHIDRYLYDVYELLEK